MDKIMKYFENPWHCVKVSLIAIVSTVILCYAYRFIHTAHGVISLLRLFNII